MGKALRKLEQYRISTGKQGVKSKLVVDKLYVNGKEWKENVPPTNINVNNYEESQKIHIYHAPKLSASSSTFQGHVIKLQDPTLYKAALYKLFQDHVVARATHNIWAIKCGSEVAYADDGEHMAGFKLLELLRNHNINNILVVVTRWYGGTHVGPQRFRCITETAMKALECAGVIKPDTEGTPAMLLTKEATHGFKADIETRANAFVQELSDQDTRHTITETNTDVMHQEKTLQGEMQSGSGLGQGQISGTSDNTNASAMGQNSSYPWSGTNSNDPGPEHAGLSQTRFQEIVQPSG